MLRNSLNMSFDSRIRNLGFNPVKSSLLLCLKGLKIKPKIKFVKICVSREAKAAPNAPKKGIIIAFIIGAVLPNHKQKVVEMYNL